MHCGVSVSELYGIIVLRRQLNILFKAFPPIVLTIVNRDQVIFSKGFGVKDKTKPKPKFTRVIKMII